VFLHFEFLDLVFEPRDFLFLSSKFFRLSLQPPFQVIILLVQLPAPGCLRFATSEQKSRHYWQWRLEFLCLFDP